jgi:hypothetical protein
MTTYRIVRRAFSTYTDIELVEGWVNAELRAMSLKATNRDGDYLVRGIDEPNWSPEVRSGVSVLY